MVEMTGGQKLTAGQVHCHLEGQITKYGYTETKPAAAMRNETVPETGFDHRDTDVYLE